MRELSHRTASEIKEIFLTEQLQESIKMRFSKFNVEITGFKRVTLG